MPGQWFEGERIETGTSWLPLHGEQNKGRGRRIARVSVKRGSRAASERSDMSDWTSRDWTGGGRQHELVLVLVVVMAGAGVSRKKQECEQQRLQRSTEQLSGGRSDRHTSAQ